MSDDKQPLIQDNDRTTKGGPQKGLAFMVIVGVGIAAIVIAAIVYIAFF
ncbi:MAG: hypothetical protein ACPGYV_01120 [Phycisphaeraceae bacterium]